MTYRGTVAKGVVLLDKSAALPDGTEVEVRPVRVPKASGQTQEHVPTPAEGPTPRGRARGRVRRPAEMAMREPLTLAHRRAFMRLPMQERRRILAEQADRMAEHYEHEAEVRELGGGDFVEQ